MKLVMAVVQADDAKYINDELVNAGHRVTRMATTGGWLRRENVTFLIGTEDQDLDDVLSLLQKNGKRRVVYMTTPQDTLGAVEGQIFDVEVGGATVFVLDVERYERY